MIVSTDRPTRRAADLDDDDDDDVRLLEAIREGDAAAVGELYQRYVTDVRRYAASRLRGDSDDIVSEAFARTLRAIRNGAGPRDHPLRYLFVTARTIIIAEHERQVRRDEADRSYVLATSVPSGEHVSRVTVAVHHAFSTLPRRQQVALWRSLVEGDSAEEIGRELRINATAVHSLAFRARRALRDAYLVALGGEE